MPNLQFDFHKQNCIDFLLKRKTPIKWYIDYYYYLLVTMNITLVNLKDKQARILFHAILSNFEYPIHLTFLYEH